jgi:hypothetical protein
VRVRFCTVSRRITCAVVILVVTVATAACKRPKNDPVAEKPYVPFVRRTVAPECVVGRASEPDTLTVPRGSTCHADSECTDGLNGRCTVHYIGMGARINECSYDECLRDDHCGAGKACDCRTSPESWGASTCVPATCRTDVDCASGFCARSSPVGLVDREMWLVGWACRSPGDECTKDSECNLGNTGACMYRRAASRFECSYGARN